MKRFLLSLIPLLAISQLYAQTSQLVISENFSDYTNGNLNTGSAGQGSWKASFTNNSSDFIQVASSSPLMYPDYTCGTQYINVIQKGDYEAGSWKYPDDPHKAFKSGLVQINSDNTVFYLSFLVRVPSAAGVQSTGDARPNIALRTVNGSQFANFYIGNTENGTRLKFGINKDGGSKGIYTEPTYNFNTTYLVVIRYDIANGETSGDYDDKMYMWINPSLSAEPSTSLAQVAIDNFWDFNYDGGFNTPAQSLELFQESNSATASLDAFKVAYAQGFETDAANSAAAWNALSPAGAPLPLKFSNLKAYIKNKSVELEWSVYAEFNVQRYEIERSTDGVSFSYAGTVSAKNEESESTFYTWVDGIPFAGNNYYRVKNIYAIDKSVYSSIVRVGLKYETCMFSIYPNPVSGNHILIRVTDLQKGDYKIEIFDTNDRQVYKKQFSHAGGTINQPIDLPAVLQTGIYNIQLTGTAFKLAKQFLVQ